MIQDSLVFSNTVTISYTWLILWILMTIGTIIIGLIFKPKLERSYKLLLKKLKVLKLKISPLNYSIAISIKSESNQKSGDYFNELKSNFFKHFNELGLARKITIIDISDKYLFNTDRDAKSFRREKNLDLLIWGEFSDHTLKTEGEIIDDLNLKFTYPIPTKRSKELLSEIEKTLYCKKSSKKLWEVVESDAQTSINFIAKNTIEITGYLLGVSLALRGKIEKAQEIFERFYFELKERNDSFSKTFEPLALETTHMLALEYKDHHDTLDLAISYFNKLLKIMSNNYPALCGLAYCYYKKGLKSKSEEYISKLVSLYPGKSNTILDRAFFKILNMEYDEAFRFYERLLKLKRWEFMPTLLSEFFENEYKKIKEPALIFACGFIEYNFGDVVTGMKDFKRFVKLVHSKDYDLMIRYAKCEIEKKDL